MNFDSLIASQTKNAGFDPQIKSVVTKDYAPVQKGANKFNTTHNKTNAPEESEQSKSFSDFMDSLKKKTSSKTEDQSDTTQEKVNAINFLRNTPLFAYHTETKAESTTTITDQTQAVSGETDISQTASLNADILKLFAAVEEQHGSAAQTQTDQTKIQTVVKEMPESLGSILALFAKISDDANSGSQDTDTQNGLIAKILDTLEQLKASDEGLFVTLNVTPQEMADLKTKLENALKQELSAQDEEQLQALAAQWLTLTPPAKENAVATTQNATDTAKSDPSLNVMQPEATKQTSTLPPQHFTQERYENRYEIDPANLNADGGDGSDAPMQKDASPIGAKAAQTDGQATAALTEKTVPQNFSDLLSGLTASTSALDPDLNPQAGNTVAIGTGAQSTAAMTNISSHASAAGHAHPATQTVAATLQKFAKAGEDSTIKLRLDPPELGRVEVKMSIGKDNVAKIVLTAEKPETFLMLQRDAHVLERALQDAGLNTDSGLSFELAQDGSNFGQDGNSGGGHHEQGGTGSGTENPEEQEIETTMNWRVDPQTGRMHYNILV